MKDGPEISGRPMQIEDDDIYIKANSRNVVMQSDRGIEIVDSSFVRWLIRNATHADFEQWRSEQ